MDKDRWERKMHRFERRMHRMEHRWDRDRTRWQQRFPHKHGLVPGALILGLGIVFLLGNMGVLDVGYVFRFWPLILVAVGLFKLVESGDNYAHSSGIFWIVVGGLFFLGNIGLLRDALDNFWPVILIGVGSLMLWRSVLIKRPPNTYTPDPDPTSSASTEAGVGSGTAATSDAASTGPTASSDSVITAMAILGGAERRNNCQDFRGGSVTAVMGRCEIDLRGASIVSPHEPVLEVFSMWGGIEIRVPPDWIIVSNVAPIMGGYSDDTQPPKEASKRLEIRGAVIMGGLEVTN
jgi:predicted membrane protein